MFRWLMRLFGRTPQQKIIKQNWKLLRRLRCRFCTRKVECESLQAEACDKKNTDTAEEMNNATVEVKTAEKLKKQNTACDRHCILLLMQTRQIELERDNQNL